MFQSAADATSNDNSKQESSSDTNASNQLFKRKFESSSNVQNVNPLTSKKLKTNKLFKL